MIKSLRKIQRKGYALRAQDALPDSHCETDEIFHNAGEKGEMHSEPANPLRLTSWLSSLITQNEHEPKDATGILLLSAHPIISCVAEEAEREL